MIQTIDKLRKNYKNISINAEWSVSGAYHIIIFTFLDGFTYREYFSYDEIFDPLTPRLAPRYTYYDVIEKKLLIIINNRRIKKLERING